MIGDMEHNKAQKLWFLLNGFDRNKESNLDLFSIDKEKYPFFYLLFWNEKFNPNHIRKIALKSQSRTNYYHSIADINEISNELIPLKLSNQAFDQNQIIDQFLRELPSIPRIKKSVDSLEYEEIDLTNPIYSPPISESYAIILQKQQKYKQAIEIYEKLILSKPEKRLYFATRISELKKI